MGVLDWNWRLEGDEQDVPWDCSAASLAWALRTIGRPLSEAAVVQGMGPSRISPELGLLDASGAGIVAYLAEIGVSAENDPNASWQEIVDAAGFQPMVMGGRRWYHWVAVRMGSAALGVDVDEIVLMNPAPGYKGVGQVMTPADFDRLGSFSAVWFTGW